MRKVFILLISSFILISCGSHKKYITRVDNVLTKSDEETLLCNKILEAYSLSESIARSKKGPYYDPSSKYYLKDSNEVIMIMKADLEIPIDIINKKHSALEAEIKKLNNPPGKYKNLYQDVLKLYGSVSEYVSLVNNPKDSLVTRSNELDSEILELLNQIKIQLPEDQ